MYCNSYHLNGGHHAMIREFKADDVSELSVQPKQAHYKDHVNQLAISGQLETAFTYSEDGKAKAIIGAQQYWKGRVAVWALVGDVSNWISCHRQVTKTLNAYAKANNVLRFELTTEIGFDESERWAKMLGFKLESTMSNFGVDGLDHKMWVMLCQQQ